MKKLALNLDHLEVDSFMPLAPVSVEPMFLIVNNPSYSQCYCPTEGRTQYDPTCVGTCRGATCDGQICIPL